MKTKKVEKVPLPPLVFRLKAGDTIPLTSGTKASILEVLPEGKYKVALPMIVSRGDKVTNVAVVKPVTVYAIEVLA